MSASSFVSKLIRDKKEIEMEKVKVISWTSTDPESVYRLDDPAEGGRFFRDMLINAETDGTETFSISEMTQEEWDQCVQDGLDDA